MSHAAPRGSTRRAASTAPARRGTNGHAVAAAAGLSQPLAAPVASPQPLRDYCTWPLEPTPLALPPAVALRGVTKVYGRGKKALTAVSGLSLDVEQGTILALLGPNGSGKSTTLNLILGTLKPTSGLITIMGLDSRRRKEIKRLTGVVPQETALYPEQTVYANLLQHARLWNVRDPKPHVERQLEMVQLQEKRKVKIRNLSGGQRRRAAIARALVHDPQLVILDEPTLGVDEGMRDTVWDTITALRDAGKTILVTTNVLSEAQRYADHVAIIAGGRLVTQVDTPDRLRQRYSGTVVTVGVQDSTTYLQGALTALHGLADVERVTVDPPADHLSAAVIQYRLALTMRDGGNIGRAINAIAEYCDLDGEFSAREPTLAEAFLDLTGPVPAVRA